MTHALLARLRIPIVFIVGFARFITNIFISLQSKGGVTYEYRRKTNQG